MDCDRRRRACDAPLFCEKDARKVARAVQAYLTMPNWVRSHNRVWVFRLALMRVVISRANWARGYYL